MLRLPENLPVPSLVLIEVLFVREIYASDFDGVETARLYGNVNKSLAFSRDVVAHFVIGSSKEG